MTYLWRTMPLEICMIGYTICLIVGILIYNGKRR